MRLYKGTVKAHPRRRGENKGRAFLPDPEQSFSAQVRDWHEYVCKSREARKLAKANRENAKKQVGGLLRNELRGLGVVFDANGTGRNEGGDGLAGWPSGDHREIGQRIEEPPPHHHQR